MAQTRWENSELIYEQPAASPNAGQPIGNGRMGTMVWTSPEAIHLQINRVDVFAVNRDHPGSQFSATDYCGGIAGVVVHVGGEPEVIRVFPAWPPEWDASFRLLARGGFLISSEIKEGKVVSVEIESRLGEDCRLRNPWGVECLLAEVGGPSHKLSGEILHFPTQTAKRYRLSPP